MRFRMVHAFDGSVYCAINTGSRAFDSVRTISYDDGVTPTVTLTRDERVRLLTQSDGSGSRTLSYTDGGELERETQGDGTALTYEYDAAGRRVGYALWDEPRPQWAMWGVWGYDSATGRVRRISDTGRLDLSYVTVAATGCSRRLSRKGQLDAASWSIDVENALP
jgi:YD repeat-containing protein